MEIAYNFKLQKYLADEDVKLLNYQDDNGHFKSTTPTSIQDKIVVEHLTGLMEKLCLNELNIDLKIKN